MKIENLLYSIHFALSNHKNHLDRNSVNVFLGSFRMINNVNFKENYYVSNYINH